MLPAARLRDESPRAKRWKTLFCSSAGTPGPSSWTLSRTLPGSRVIDVSTVVPGTVWSELAPDRGALLIHVFDLDDEAAFIHHFKTDYEQPLKEIFE